MHIDAKIVNQVRENRSRQERIIHDDQMVFIRGM